MALGDRQLMRGMTGPDVVQLQLRLAGFRGTVWDGNFGPGTELQVVCFQRDYMRQANPSGVFDSEMFAALRQFAREFPVDFGSFECECGQCGRFGQRRFRGEYLPGRPAVETFHRCEYPGMHKAIVQSLRAAAFYLTRAGFPPPQVTCGYRCWINNEQKGRQSTNHMGKAIDLDFPLQQGEDKRDDTLRCERARGLLVEQSNFQVGWAANNRKALEPANIAPTWIHMDVRCYEPPYLVDEHFVTSAEQLDG